MILPAQHIRQRALDYGMIKPFEERGVFMGRTHGLGPATYDFRCAQHIVLFPTTKAWQFYTYKLIDWILAKLEKPTRYEHYKLGFVLVSTIEEVNMPYDVCATVMDKSSWARKGLAVQNTHFDPGFMGFPTLELTNHGHEELDIAAGVAVCQFKFEMLYEPTEMPYVGKYSNQPPRPVEAIEGTTIWTGDKELVNEPV